MNANKNHVTNIKEAIHKSNSLNPEEKSQSVQRIEEWIIEDKAFGTLKQELMKISSYFEELFSELGIK